MIMGARRNSIDQILSVCHVINVCHADPAHAGCEYWGGGVTTVIRLPENKPPK